MNPGGYLFKVITERKIKPEYVSEEKYGKFSYKDVLSSTRQRVRIWAFETEEGRKLFDKDVSSGKIRKTN